MSKPAGKCAFCGETKPLTKGHIWPKCFGEILPSDANYHEQKIGSFNTFESKIPGPRKWQRVGTGPLQKRRPRNTCKDCNGGWMSRLEENAFPVVAPLILGEEFSLNTAGQRLLAPVLALVSCRIELTAHGMMTIPQDDRDFLKTKSLPSGNWRIWIARHAGSDLKDYRHSYTAMQVVSEPTARYGPEYCNTHVTTLIVGQLYAHVFFSTVWPDFSGYEGIALTRIWPPTDYYINTEFLPTMSDEDGVMLHEAVAKLGKPVADA